MKFRLLVCTLLAMIWAVSLQAQDNARIKFEETTHQFGDIDKGAPAEHTFVFTNTSEEPVTLTRVKASCGCTTPSWTREEVAPGQTGEIKVKYNTQRLGPFTKTVTVNYDSAARPIVLYIKGKVNNTGAAASQVANIYKRPMGNLAFDDLVQNLGTIDSDKEAKATFKLRNNGPLLIKIGINPEENPEMEIALSSAELAPGQTATIDVTVIGERFEKAESFTKRITLNTSDKAMPDKVLTVNGVINKVFTAEELARMPNIEFDATEYDAGKIISGEKVTYAYTFRNTGQDDLVIESVKASCGCTATAPKDKIIKGGQSSEIVATFNSSGRRGNQKKSITVRTNDPDNGVLVLRLSAEVEEDPFHVGGMGPAEQNK